jgi:hypothetical protein
VKRRSGHQDISIPEYQDIREKGRGRGDQDIGDWVSGYQDIREKNGSAKKRGYGEKAAND